MDQSRIGSHRLSARVFGAALLGVLFFGALAPSSADAQDLPPICRRRGVYDAIRTLIRFCPSGNCIPRAGIGDLLEQRVDPATLQLIASDAALYPARVFYKAGRGRFDTTDVVSRDHLAHAQADLREVARTYQRYPNSKIIVLGRASQTGDMSTNVRLSQERARRVADYLHRTFNISYDDIHQAYFGSRLFQMQPGDLPSLGIAADDLPRGADGQADVALAANQSTVAFVFPCPETVEQQQAQAAAEAHPDERCPIDEDGGVPQAAPAAPVVAPPAACRSELVREGKEIPTRVYLTGGKLRELFAQYLAVLGKRTGKRDLRELSVMYPAANEQGVLEWRTKTGSGIGINWFTADPAKRWEISLDDIEVPVAPIPEHSFKADIYCGVNPPAPLISNGGCSVAHVGAGSRSSRLPAAGLFVALGFVLVRRLRRRPVSR
jgi:hypothetical protein